MRRKITFTVTLLLSAALLSGQKTATVTQSIDLNSGWNLFSVYLNPDFRDMKILFQNLITDGSLIKVQDETGNSLEDFGVFGGWTNHIGDIYLSKGYKVKVSRNCQLKLNGVPIALPLEIPLKAGWNIMGYPRNIELDGKEAVQQLIDRKTMVKVQDETGKAIEDYGVFSGWTNHIGNFIPGEGYKIKVTKDEILIIPEPLTITGRLVSRSNCKNFGSAFPAYTTPDTVSCIEYTYNPNNHILSVQHRNAAFNCCPGEIYCNVTEINDTIIIKEYEKSSLCNCLCLFDLDIEVSGVEADKYIIRFAEPYAGAPAQIIFEINLLQTIEGLYCISRKKYPWGM